MLIISCSQKGKTREDYYSPNIFILKLENFRICTVSQYLKPFIQNKIAKNELNFLKQTSFSALDIHGPGWVEGFF